MRPQHPGQSPRPLPRTIPIARQAIKVLPAHDATKAVRPLLQYAQHLLERPPVDEPAAVSRVRDEADDELLGRPPFLQHHVVHEGVGKYAPAAVELGIVPGNVAAAHDLERLVVEAAEVLGVVEQGHGDGGKGDGEGRPKVGAQPVDEAHRARKAHVLFNIEVEAVEAAGANHVAEREVVALEAGLVAVEALVATLGRAAEHAHHLDARGLQDAQLRPEGLVARVRGDMVVEGEGGRVVVDVDGGEDDVRDRDAGLREQREDGDGLVLGVVQGLVV